MMSYRELVVQIEAAIERKNRHELIARMSAEWAKDDAGEIERLRSELASIPEAQRKCEEEAIFRGSYKPSYNEPYNELEDVPNHGLY